jgi:transposase-like protein
MPTQTDYDAWFRSNQDLIGRKARTVMTGPKLYRLVKYMDSDMSGAEAARALGVDRNVVYFWLKRLPNHLLPERNRNGL